MCSVGSVRGVEPLDSGSVVAAFGWRGGKGQTAGGCGAGWCGRYDAWLIAWEAKMKVLADENRIGELVGGMVKGAGLLMGERAEPWVIVGMRSRGDLLARRMAEHLGHAGVGSVDITMHRDDLSEIGPQPVVRTSDLGCGIDGMNVLLVDDVLMTGRSVRAAMGVLLDYGRPRCIRMAVLVDRGGRELPIAADVVGLRVEAGADEMVEVRLKPQDPEDVIVRYDRPKGSRVG